MLDAFICPGCSSSISLFALLNQNRDDATRITIGAVLKKCPSCQKWTWMNSESQAAA